VHQLKIKVVDIIARCNHEVYEDMKALWEKLRSVLMSLHYTYSFVVTH